MSSALAWSSLTRADGVRVEQARARNNSWYLIVPETPISFVLRYASQSGNEVVSHHGSVEDAKRGAERHADRYDTRD